MTNRHTLPARLLGCTFAVLLSNVPMLAFAQTGVSDDRVSLPEGPGSVDGFSDNAQVNTNMGVMSYSVKIDVPAGFPGVTPGLSLGYSSSAGNTVMGMGWDLPVQTIERTTVRGLPEYSTADEFAANGSQQLVHLPTSSPAEYRFRFEGAFVRFRWHERGTGAEGYWTAERPDGVIEYYGADAASTYGGSDAAIALEARTGLSTVGTFRYYLRESVDPFGNRLVYHYRDSIGTATEGTTKLLDYLEYVFDASGNASYRVEFDYEVRGDIIADCKAGYCEELAHRMSGVRVFSADVQIKRYAFTYQTLEVSGGLSRLTDVEIFGREGGQHAAHFSFDYSRSLGDECTGDGCEQPYLTTMGSLAVDLQAGAATLIDINGDALPDVVDTRDGVHRFFISQLAANGDQSFAAPVNSALSGISGYQLDNPGVQVLDINGDGFTDLVDNRNGAYLQNKGAGDWVADISLFDPGSSAMPAFADTLDLSDGGELDHVRFFDFDNDKRIDMLMSTDVSTLIYENRGNGGFGLVSGTDDIGAGFATDELQLSDMNGDGMLDAVLVRADGLRYRLNLGHGAWGPWEDVTDVSVTAAEIPFVELEDINGDELSDLVIVQAQELRYSLNRNGSNFTPWRRVDTAGGQLLPVRLDTTTVLYADMNGNGSTDVVWITNSGAVTYLELFPVKPNLLSRIENGLGMVTEISYDASVNERAASATPWAYRLPHPMTVVSRTDTWDELSMVHEVSTYSYRDGYYDGIEKQFRGYERVQVDLVGDEFQEGGHTEILYSIGRDDVYHHGQVLEEVKSAGGEAITAETKVFGECTVAGLPPGQTFAFDVRSVCLHSHEHLLQERAPETDWVTTSVSFDYDGYGNTVVKSEMGVTSVGGDVCEACGDREAGAFGAPCGAQCIGDERYTETDFATPLAAMGRWRPRLITRESTYADPASPNYTEKLTYYDGTDYQGLANGQFELGALKSVEELRTTGVYVVTQAHRHDGFGNIVESLDALGTDGSSGHRRQWTYDASGQNITETRLFLQDSSAQPYELLKSFEYEPVWNKVVSSTEWYAEIGGSAATAINTTLYTYDEFGRLLAVASPSANPGDATVDTLASPTQQLVYNYGSPISKVAVRKRTTVGGAFDIETVRCFDGRGKLYQERVAIGGGEYQVDGFKRFNTRGSLAEESHPYRSSSADCDLEIPAGVAKLSYFRDASYRELTATVPDASLYGSASVRESVYLPLMTVQRDPLDVDSTSPHAETPRTNITDGLGRLVRVERMASAAVPALVHQIFYDDFGNLRGYRDPEGNERLQVYDRMGRVLRVDDPDSGLVQYTYDDQGNKMTMTDARGMVSEFAYDGANRLIGEWESGDEAATRVDYVYDMPQECPTTSCVNTAGLLVELHHPLGDLGTGDDWYGYNARGKMGYFSRRLGAASFDFMTHYDNVGQVVGSTYPNGKKVDLTLDAGGRLVGVPGYVNALAYDERGDIQSVAYASGASSVYEHDAVRRVNDIVISGPLGESWVDLDIERDRASNVIALADHIGQGAFNQTAEFTYDGLYRLATASLGAGADAEALTYSYDNIDNIVSKTSSVATSKVNLGAYSYGSAGPHAVTEAGGVHYSYDASGYMTSRGGASMDWDHMGRMTSVQEGADETARMYYGNATQRLVKREGASLTYYVNSEYEVHDGHAVIYVKVADKQLVKIELGGIGDDLSDVAPAAVTGSVATPAPDGLITAGDAWIAQAYTLPTDMVASDVERLLQGSVRRMLSGVDTTSDESVSFYHHDHNGNVVAVSDGAGAMVQQTSYYPYGGVRAGDAGFGEDRRFSGKETDASTGLTYYGARYADLYLGRFISPDPNFEIIGGSEPFKRPDEATGAYIFTGNNPTTLRDEDGRFINHLAGGLIGFAVGFGAEVVRHHFVDKKVNPSAKFNWGKALTKGAVGAAMGALTSGLSAISTATGIATEAVAFNHYHKKLVRNAQESVRAEDRVVRANQLERARTKAAMWGLGVSVVTSLGVGLGSSLTSTGDAVESGLRSASIISDTTELSHGLKVGLTVGVSALAAVVTTASETRSQVQALDKNVHNNNIQHAQNVGVAVLPTTPMKK